MNFAQCFSLAIKNIAANKTRSILTMLGIIIGVAAVIVITGLGNGMDIYMRESFESMGTNSFSIYVYGRGDKYLTADDMQEIVDDNQDLLDKASPELSGSPGTIKIGTSTLSATQVAGVNEQYFDIKGVKVDKGRNIQYIDCEKRMQVCVIGTYINQSFFAGRGIGESIKIAGSDYKVIGIMEKKGDGSEYSADNCIFLPYSTVSRLSGKGNIDSFAVSFKDSDKAADAKKLIEDKLTEYFGSSDAFYVSSISEYLEEFTRMSNIMVTILTLIAGISLVVGGIGIMNIMLVSVTERTKEIGIRKALGAKERYILAQFVIEAGVTSALGGLIGIALGYLLSAAASQVIVRMFQQQMRVQPSINSVLLSFGISAGIGVFFGFMPAKKAAKLNPIDALRYD